jgi:hypothetical protein
VLNLFNQRPHGTSSISQPRWWYLKASSAISGGSTSTRADYNALIRAAPDGATPSTRYGMDDLFEPGTRGKVSVKFLF